jgi:hypothetical protein
MSRLYSPSLSVLAALIVEIKSAANIFYTKRTAREKRGVSLI